MSLYTTLHCDGTEQKDEVNEEIYKRKHCFFWSPQKDPVRINPTSPGSIMYKSSSIDLIPNSQCPIDKKTIVFSLLLLLCPTRLLITLY